MKALSVLIVILGLFLAAWGAYFLLSPLEEEIREPDRVVLREDGTAFEILDVEGKTIFIYTIEEWRTWAEANWSRIFTVPIMIGDQEMEAGRFYRFDAVSLSPDRSKAAFSTSAYAMATDVSLVGLFHTEDGTVKMFDHDNFGQIGEFSWSPAGGHLAYVLDTARAAGDRLSVDNVRRFQKEFTLGHQDIFWALEASGHLEQDGLNPDFRDLSWSDREARLLFKTNALSDQVARWSITAEGKDLELLEIGPKDEETIISGTLLINVPGRAEQTWHLSYEEPGMPGLIQELNFGETSKCLGSIDFCRKLEELNDEISGRPVSVSGIRHREGIAVDWIEPDKEEQTACNWSFDHFHVDVREISDPLVDFSTRPEARQFETRIKEGVEEGPNFAGRFALIEWGCGTNCQELAVVDLGNGKIVEYGLTASLGFDYRPDSRLLLVNPPDRVDRLSPDSLLAEVESDYFIMETEGLSWLCRR